MFASGQQLTSIITENQLFDPLLCYSNQTQMDGVAEPQGSARPVGKEIMRSKMVDRRMRSFPIENQSHLIMSKRV